MERYLWDADIPPPVPAMQRPVVHRPPVVPMPGVHGQDGDIAAPVPATNRATVRRRPVPSRRRGHDPASDIAPPVPARERHLHAMSVSMADQGQGLQQLVPEGRLPKSVQLTSVPRRIVAALLELVLFVATLGLGWCLWALLTADNGQTPARELLGQRVISARDGEPFGLAGMLVDRGLFGTLIHGLAIVCTGFVLAFMPLWDERNRTVCDRLSKSIVVNDPYGLLL